MESEKDLVYSVALLSKTQEIKFQNDSKSRLGQNSDDEHYQMLNAKIYEPYFISNNTILDFQKYGQDRKLSLQDVFSKFNANGNSNSKYYF